MVVYCYYIPVVLTVTTIDGVLCNIYPVKIGYAKSNKDMAERFRKAETGWRLYGKIALSIPKKEQLKIITGEWSPLDLVNKRKYYDDLMQKVESANDEQLEKLQRTLDEVEKDISVLEEQATREGKEEVKKCTHLLFYFEGSEEDEKSIRTQLSNGLHISQSIILAMLPRLPHSSSVAPTEYIGMQPQLVIALREAFINNEMSLEADDVRRNNGLLGTHRRLVTGAAYEAKRDEIRTDVIIENYLRRLKYTRTRVSGDNHCMFRSMLKHLKSDFSVQSLRDIIADHIFSDDEMRERVVAVLNDNQTLDQYCENVKNEMWGGEQELVAASRIFQRRIRVVRFNDSDLVYGDEYGGEEILLFYNGLNHYDILERTQE